MMRAEPAGVARTEGEGAMTEGGAMMMAAMPETDGRRHDVGGSKHRRTHQ